MNYIYQTKTWIIEYYDILDDSYHVFTVRHGKYHEAMETAVKCGCWPVVGVR